MAEDQGDYLTVEEACKLLGIGRAYFYRVAKRLPRFRRQVNGRKVLFRRQDIEDLRQPRRTEDESG